jgi:hypothetical protein
LEVTTSRVDARSAFARTARIHVGAAAHAELEVEDDHVGAHRVDRVDRPLLGTGDADDLDPARVADELDQHLGDGS